MTHDLLAQIASVLFTLASMGFIVFVTLRLACSRPEQPLQDDQDFEEFYLDLHREALTVDFSREEAEGLYRVWLRQEKVAN